MQPASIRYRSTLSILLSLSLLFSFGLHAVQIQHGHFEVSEHNERHSHEGSHAVDDSALDVTMHLLDKKLLLWLGAALLLAVFFEPKKLAIRLLVCASRTAKISHDRYGNIFRMHDYLCLFFKKGIFHTKAY